MIEAAGGVPLLGKPGAKSERVTWEAVHEARPDVVVAAPCGYDRAGRQALADELVAAGVLPRRRPGARRRRERRLGAAGHPAGRRGRGAGRILHPVLDSRSKQTA